MMHNTFSLVKNHFPLLCLLFFLGFSACADQASCITDDTSVIGISFLKIDMVDPGSPADTINNLSIYAEDGNWRREDSVSGSISVPLNLSSNQVSFIIQQDTIIDTLRIGYTREQQIISPDCGITQQIRNLHIVSPAFDSSRVAQTDITRFNSPQISIYNCRYDRLDNIVKIRFYRRDTTAAGVVQAVRDTVNIAAVTNDRGNVLYQNAGPQTSLLVPVYADAQAITLNIQKRLPDNSLETAVLPLEYLIDTTSQIASCRPQRRYSQLDTLSAGAVVDSVVVEATLLDRYNAENIKLFF